MTIQFTAFIFILKFFLNTFHIVNTDLKITTHGTFTPFLTFSHSTGIPIIKFQVSNTTSEDFASRCDIKRGRSRCILSDVSIVIEGHKSGIYIDIFELLMSESENRPSNLSLYIFGTGVIEILIYDEKESGEN